MERDCAEAHDIEIISRCLEYHRCCKLELYPKVRSEITCAEINRNQIEKLNLKQNCGETASDCNNNNNNDKNNKNKNNINRIAFVYCLCNTNSCCIHSLFFFISILYPLRLANVLCKCSASGDIPREFQQPNIIPIMWVLNLSAVRCWFTTDNWTSGFRVFDVDIIVV